VVLSNNVPNSFCLNIFVVMHLAGWWSGNTFASYSTGWLFVSLSGHGLPFLCFRGFPQSVQVHNWTLSYTWPRSLSLTFLPIRYWLVIAVRFKLLTASWSWLQINTYTTFFLSSPVFHTLQADLISLYQCFYPKGSVLTYRNQMKQHAIMFQTFLRVLCFTAVSQSKLTFF
jgi:hypothetical protein